MEGVADESGAEFVHGNSRYIRIRTVGKGAFGTAVLYRKEPEEQLVVLKRVRVAELSAAERARALAEARLLAALAHDNIVRYVGSWEAAGAGLLLLEMEYASGGTLAQLLASTRRPLTEAVVVNLFSQVVAAVRHVHALGVLHRDLKTENIFLTEERAVKVGDFGIAKALGSQLQADTVLGTPHCLSPEMCSGLPYDHKSDVWALGCVLYELMCRRRAFAAASLPALVRLIVAAEVAPPPVFYSAPLRSLLAALLRRDPAARPSAAVIEDALLPPLVADLLAAEAQAEAEDGRPALATPPPTPSPRTVVYQVRGGGTGVGGIALAPVPLPPRTVVLQLDASSTHCVALTSEQLVFTWDVSAGEEVRRTPLCVHSVTGLGVTSIAAGGGFTVYATEAGAVLTSGDGTAGRLGHGDEAHCGRPKLVESLLSASIVAVAAGEGHTLALSAAGHVFSWGSGSHGQLGGGKKEDRWLAAAAPLPGGAIPLAVRAGPAASAVVCTDGQLLCCGDNSAGQLSGWRGGWQRSRRRRRRRGAGDRCWLRLSRVHSADAAGVRDVRLGAACTAVLLDSGSLMVLGGAHQGRYLLHADISMICAGDGHVAAVSRDQTLLVWGRWGEGCTDSIETKRKEIIALYASDEQRQRGATLVASAVVALPSALLLCVSTTAPVARLARKGGPQADNKDADSLGPVPEWLQEELALAEEEWPGPL